MKHRVYNKCFLNIGNQHLSHLYTSWDVCSFTDTLYSYFPQRKQSSKKYVYSYASINLQTQLIGERSKIYYSSIIITHNENYYQKFIAGV